MTAFDPANPTFYGECLPVDQALDVAGSAIGGKYTGPYGNGTAIQYYWTEPSGSDLQWADAGDSFIVGIYPEYSYLQRDSPVEFTVVIEFTTETNAQIRLHAGSDPNWDLTDPSLATEDLGTFDVAPGRFLAPIKTWTAPLIYDKIEQPIIYMEVLSGRVVMRQLRVRMWPPGGPSGSWAPEAAYEKEYWPNVLTSGGQVQVTPDPVPQQALGTGGPERHLVGPGLWGGWDDMGDTNAAFGAMAGALSGGLPPYQAFAQNNFSQGISGGYTYWWALHQLGNPSHDWSGGYTTGLALLIFQPLMAGYRENGYGYVDPDRIPWEAASSVRAGGSLGTWKSSFGGWVALPQVNGTDGSPNNQYVSVRVYAMPGEPDWSQTESGWNNGFWYNYFLSGGIWGSSGGSYPGNTAGTLLLPGSPNVGVEVAPTFLYNAPTDYRIFDYSNEVGFGSYVSASRDVDLSTAKQLHIFEGGEYFDPALAWVPDGLDPEPTVQPGTVPGAGYYVFPDPNLDGESNGVNVHFASAT